MSSSSLSCSLSLVYRYSLPYLLNDISVDIPVLHDCVTSVRFGCKLASCTERDKDSCFKELRCNGSTNLWIPRCGTSSRVQVERGSSRATRDRDCNPDCQCA